MLGLLEQAIGAGQKDGSVRAGDPAVLARTVLLAAHGFVLSGETMVDERLTVDDLDAELRALTERYLAR